MRQQPICHIQYGVRNLSQEMNRVSTEQEKVTYAKSVIRNRIRLRFQNSEERCIVFYHILLRCIFAFGKYIFQNENSTNQFMIVSSRNKAIKTDKEYSSFAHSPIRPFDDSPWFGKGRKSYDFLCNMRCCANAFSANRMVGQVMWSHFAIYFKVVANVSCVRFMVFTFCNLRCCAISWGTNCTQYTDCERPGPQ